MNINFLPEEDRPNKSVQKNKEHLLPKEKEKWSNPQKTGETKNEIVEKMGVKKYLPNFQIADFFKNKKENFSRSVGIKNIKESRKELLQFIGQQKAGDGKTMPPTKEDIKKVFPSFNSGQSEQAQNKEVIKEKIIEPELKIKKIRNKIKLPDFSGAFSFFPKFLSKLKRKKLKKDVVQANFIKEENVKNEERNIAPQQVPGEKEKKEAPKPLNEIKDKQILEEKEKIESREEKREKEILLAKERESSQAMETNLIKDEIILFFDWKKAWISLSVSVLLTILLLGVGYGLLSWQISQKEKDSQTFAQKFVEIDKEIKSVEREAEPALVFKKKLSLVNSILSQHIYWTNFFKFLEEDTLSNVYYLGFSGDNKGKYSISANAKEFSLIETQVKKFLEDKRVLGANVSQGTISTTSNKETGETAGVNFELKLNVNPSIFTK